MSALDFPSLPFELHRNPFATPGADFGPCQAAYLSGEGLAAARRCITAWPGYEPTPLLSLPALAAALRIGALHYKQEAARFELRSFKPLGGAYAVQRCLMRVVASHTGRADVTPDDILERRHPEIVGTVTVTAATDGNHGRAVAWGARLFGCRCVIYINEAVSPVREAAIAAYGAEVRRHPGSFDDAVREAFAAAEREGWQIIPDTSDGSALEAPGDVIQGYAVMAAEAIEQLPFGAVPSHVFLQAGVGGMAAACAGELWRHFGRRRPSVILVEPREAACWFASLSAGRPTPAKGSLESFMGGLACGTVSPLAWDILQPGAQAAMVIDDGVAQSTMRLLADGIGDDPPVVAGESGVAGLAGLITAARDPAARDSLGLDGGSRVLVVGSEGATDEALYEEVVGRPWREVCHG